MTRTHSVYLIVCVFVLLATCGYLFLKNIDYSFRTILAVEQTDVFEGLADRAYESLKKSPPDFQAAEEFIEGIKNYYPSGTKQTAGSAMDLVVERARSSAILAITFKMQALKIESRMEESTESPIQP